MREHTRASLMSDIKWRKLLEVLDEASIELRQCTVKFVGRPQEHIVRRHAIDLRVPWPWADISEFGPTPLRSIEWVLFPRVAEYDRGVRGAPKRRVEQDLDRAAQIIATLGKYPLEMTERGLLIRGYLPAEDEP